MEKGADKQLACNHGQGQLTLEKGADRELAWNHGRMWSTLERVAEKIGSSEEDQVKMSRHSSCFVEFALVTHASVSPYMLSKM